MQALRLPVVESSQVSDARRRARNLAGEYGWPDTELGEVELVVTELAKNLVKHSEGGGEVLVWAEPERDALSILSLDSGPGIANVARALTDGYSTAGSPGTGLGAVKRLAAKFDLYSRPAGGTALLARLERQSGGDAELAVRASGLRLPMAGEDACGDGIAWATSGGRFLAFVVDGLGHGIMAADAADVALRIFRKNLHLPPERLLEAVHLALRSTRGGVAAVAEVSADRDRVDYVGIGNINAVLHTPDGDRNLVSYNGTLGQEVRKFQKFSYPWTGDSLLVMHSDGLSNRWNLASYPGLDRKLPGVVAGVLYRDFGRTRDDLSVLVARQCQV